MAATSGVWGIDIGQCALKALRCEYDAENRILMATAFDFIEYPKILSQPDADPKELIGEALQQFLDRNELKGDSVSLSVPGQNGLARFFQPPPVDMRKLPDIVRFEARQQIPFPLEEVIWDFQLMGGASEVEGFLMEAEVGLFAMKRDQVYEAIEPFLGHEVEIDIVQLAPLCAYNFVAHNLMTDELEADVYDPDNPPESFVILNVGTDTTDMVVTNGFRVWQRNIPLGGNHFTKQLTKELKLTFAKAEHLKRNVREAEDAKAVIQAMRPVFNDLLTEVQRSIGFFQNIDRSADITGMIMLGNAVKLPGLQQYLAKNLGYELVDVDHSSWAARLAGQSVLTSPQFKENMHAFGNCYGLCLQGLGRAKLNTNLLPKEILTERLIRAKKPWALATAAALMLAFAINFFFEYAQWYKVHPDMLLGDVTWKEAMSDVDTVQGELTTNEQKDAEQVTKLKKLTALGRELSGNSDRRLLWLELMKAINRALPQDENVGTAEIPDPKESPIALRKELHIEYIESQYFPELSTWFNGVKVKYLDELDYIRDTDPSALPTSDPGSAAADTAGAATDPAAPSADPLAATVDPAAGATDSSAEGGDTGPSGAGWVIELKGYHYFNHDDNKRIAAGVHVRNTLMKNLRKQTIELPRGPGQESESFRMDELGIGYVVLTYEPRIEQDHKIMNPFYEGPKTGTDRSGFGQLGQFGLGDTQGTTTTEPAEDGAASAGEASDTGDEASGASKEEPDEPPYFDAPKFDFIVQFCWQEQMLSERLNKRFEAQQASDAADVTTTGADATNTGTDSTTTGADSDGAAPPTGG